MKPSLLIITDPGPDPDDAEALLLAWKLHRQDAIRLVGVVANGGGHPAARARLARCLLDRVGATSIPVGIGSAGMPISTQPHEYALDGYAHTSGESLMPGATLILHALEEAAPKSLIVLIIASMRDFKDAIEQHAQLVLEKVHSVGIMGGLVEDPDSSMGYAPDASVNNMFDLDAAQHAYAWCIEHGLPMTVVTRQAVPLLPMQLVRGYDRARLPARTRGARAARESARVQACSARLSRLRPRSPARASPCPFALRARSFADRFKCPVISYVANAQFHGLVGLWQRLNAGELPARCTRKWFFETFCSVSKDEYEATGLDCLDGSMDITPYLIGYARALSDPAVRSPPLPCHAHGPPGHAPAPPHSPEPPPLPPPLLRRPFR
jgi:hypothetical protein